MNKDELIQYALEHTKLETFLKFNTSSYKLKKYCLMNNIEYEDLFKFRSFSFIKKIVTADLFREYYYHHNVLDTCAYFRIGSHVFDQCMKYFNCEKTQDMINDTRKDTVFNRYGVDYVALLPSSKENSKKTRFIKYGDANYVNIEQALKTREIRHGSRSYHNIEKMKLTNLERRGVEYSFQDPVVVLRAQKTKDERYDNSTYNNKEQAKLTCLKKFGYVSNLASPDDTINGRGTQKKIYAETGDWNNRGQFVKTCKERHGDDYFLNQINMMIHSISSRANSLVNDDFFDYLVRDIGIIPQQREFRVNNFWYDFKFGNYLIELDPYATHNSSWAIYGDKPKDEYYHRRKTLNALEEGYKCIHIFDWMSFEPILYHIMQKDLDIIDTGKPVKHIFDTKTKKLTNKETDTTVIIYDDGFNIIY